MKKTPAAAADRIIFALLGLQPLPLPGRVPCLIGLEREAIAVRDALEARAEKLSRQHLATVRPGKVAA